MLLRCITCNFTASPSPMRLGCEQVPGKVIFPSSQANCITEIMAEEETISYKTPGNVTFSAVKNVRLERNTFTHLGAAAMSFEYGCQNNTVIGNVFQDISSSAIWMGNVYDEGHNVSAYYNNTDSAVTYSGSFSRSYNWQSNHLRLPG